jgi:hypothetical protein
MHLKRISSILQYTGWLLKKYSEQSYLQNDIYRIAELKKSTHSDPLVLVQVIGKSVFLECTPQEILVDDKMLEGFSKKDIRAITYFACEEMRRPKFKIEVQEFCGRINRMIFRIKSKDDKEVSKSASQILLDKEMVESLSKKDLTSVSYMAGYECSQNEKDEIRMYKEK